MSDRGGVRSWAFSDFQVLEELFRSANGAVMKVRRRADGKVYVLKERRAAELGEKEDILHEVNILTSISHPNIIRCYGYFLSDFGDILYIVLEYATMGDLYHEVTRRKTRGEFFTENEIWRIFEECCRGLAYLHSKSIVHRDIKVSERAHIADVAAEAPVCCASALCMH
jgi:serine/threonine protein kinase